MKNSVTALQCLTDDGYKKLSHLENHIKTCYHSQKATEGIILSDHLATLAILLAPCVGEEDVAIMVTNMLSSLQSSESEISKLKEQ